MSPLGMWPCRHQSKYRWGLPHQCAHWFAMTGNSGFCGCAAAGGASPSPTVISWLHISPHLSPPSPAGGRLFLPTGRRGRKQDFIQSPAFHGPVEEQAQGQQDPQLPQGHIDPVEPKAPPELYRQLPAHQDGVGTGGQDQGRHRPSPAPPHGPGPQEGGQAPHQKIQGQGPGTGEVEQEAPQGQPRHRRRGEIGQDAQGLRHPELDGPGAGPGQQQVLQDAQGRIEGGNGGTLEQVPDSFLHKKQKGRNAPILFPSFVYRQDGFELSDYFELIIPAKARSVKPGKRISQGSFFFGKGHV